MESGLEDRNNTSGPRRLSSASPGLNGVRPRRPEQYEAAELATSTWADVSMESGLEDRNNIAGPSPQSPPGAGLNGVRPRRPEQCRRHRLPRRPNRPVSMESGLEDRNNLVAFSTGKDALACVSMESGLEDRNNLAAGDYRGPSAENGLNGVRPRRPEQSRNPGFHPGRFHPVSMESGLEDRNNSRKP